MNTILITVGSLGNILPLVEIGCELLKRGHRVSLISTVAGERIARARGLTLCRCLALKNTRPVCVIKLCWVPSIYHLYFQRHYCKWNEKVFDTISNLAAERPLLAGVDRPGLWGDIVAQARFKLPSVRVQIDPPMFPLGRTATTYQGTPTQRRYHESCDAVWRAALAKRGVAVGYNHVERCFRHYWPRLLKIGLWPTWMVGQRTGDTIPVGFIAPRSASWEQDTLCVDTTRRDYIVFVAGTAGTTRGWLADFYQASVDLCREMDKPGIFLAGETPDVPSASSRIVQWRPFVPLDAILPFAGALVHHGGIGTAAAAIRHQVPQVIVPRGLSQPSNARWLRRLNLWRGAVTKRVLSENSSSRTRRFIE